MESEAPFFVFGMVFGMLVTFLLFVFIVPTTADWHKDIIAHGAGHYDAQTGKFVWDTPTKTEKE